jgi:hypothetical protein
VSLQFSQFGYTLGDNAKFAAESVANALETRSDSITSLVRGTDQEWPFVTINDFEVKGRNTRRNTQTELFAFCPILETPQDKTEWSSYSENQSELWLQDSYKTAVKAYGIEGGDGSFSYDNFAENAIPELVYRMEGERGPLPEDSPGPWMPLWQISPPPPNPFPINFNTLSSPDVSDIVHYLRDSDLKVPIMTERLARHSMFRSLIDQYAGITAYYRQNGDQGDYQRTPSEEADANDPFRKQRQLQEQDGDEDEGAVSNSPHNPDYENTQGYSFVLYPVYSGFDNVYPAERNLTGVLISLIRWDWIFSNVMRPDTEMIHVVMTNTCGESNYTYQVHGAEATFLGTGDWHQDRFDKNRVSTTLTKFRGVTLEGEACEFTLHAYPTLLLREAYDSDEAVIFTTILGVAFGFTALFFLFYVRVVQRRQAKVMATAARTNAIVTSLFPSNVRDRIMRDAEEAVNSNNKSKSDIEPFLPGMGEAPTRKLKTFLDSGENPSSESQLVMFKTKPIADLFPETTGKFPLLIWSSWKRQVLYMALSH